jgi:putative peptidoglycan lipid II flippase
MTSAGDVPTEVRSARDDIVTRHRGLVGRTVLVSALTLLSRVLGFVRESLTAYVFGDGSAISDAFFTAWRVPNLFRRLLGEGALSTSLQAAITEEDATGDPEHGRRLFASTLRVASGILLVVSAVCMLLVAWLPDTMPFTGWHWMGADPGPVRDLTVRLFPFVLFVCVAALCGGALQVRGHFAAPNIAPTALNLVWIASLVGVGAAFGWAHSAEGPRDVVIARQWQMARWLSWGVLVGGVLQLAVHLPALARTGLLRPRAGAVHVVRSARSGWRVLFAAAPLAAPRP